MFKSYRQAAFALLATAFALTSTTANASTNGLYMVVDSGPLDALFLVDTSDASVTQIGAGGNTGNAEGLSPSDRPDQFFAVDNSGDLIRLSRSTGNIVSQLNLSIPGDRGLAYNTLTGVLYGSDNSNFGTINTTTGAFFPLSFPAGANDIEGLAVDPVNNLVYGIDNDEDLFRYNILTDTWTMVGATGVAEGNDAGLALDLATNTLYVVDNDGELYSINPATAATVSIGNVGVTDNDSDIGLAFAGPSPRPVPALSAPGLALLALLLPLIAGFGLRRKR